MKKIEVICPKCGNKVALTNYGSYLSKEFMRFEHIYEGWCPSCVERVVEHRAPESSLIHKANRPRWKDTGC